MTVIILMNMTTIKNFAECLVKKERLLSYGVFETIKSF